MIKKVKKGFTLIELVVVIAVIAILSAVSVVAYVGITNSAKKSAAEQKAGQIVTAIRAAALSSSEGYKEQTLPSGVTEARYTVTINGKKLSFTGVTENFTEKDIINDMLEELENQGDALKCDKYRVTAADASEIGVLKQGGDATKDADHAWASF